MRGSAHTLIGATGGFIIASAMQADPTTTVTLMGLGGASGLVPDLDIDGKLRGKITFSHKIIQTIAQFIGLVIIVYCFQLEAEMPKYIGIGVGALIIGVASSLKRKHMLTMTGVATLIAGLTFDELWLILFGVYTIIASLVTHRGYTHSIIGVIYFAFIAFYLEVSLQIEGVFYTCLLGYISHLLADSKFLPFNKRGVKLFLPLSSKDF